MLVDFGEDKSVRAGCQTPYQDKWLFGNVGVGPMDAGFYLAVSVPGG
jgi:hypothetical protein